MSDFFDLINKRESCRNFADTPVTKEQLLACAEAARLAPSSTNSQPWRFLAVNGPEKSAMVAKCTQSLGMNKFTDKAPAFFIVCEEKTTLTSRLGGVVKDVYFAPIDIGLAVAHLCYAAAEQGLSTCILGWFDEKKLIRQFFLPEKTNIRLVIAIGYSADEAAREKKRKELEEVFDYFE
ncbi:MAG: nitroreductase family protein [Oscillospiraceae bacterium]|nr:nitroreductase family protein [Oscillospiraceae bacterium]